MTYLNKLHRYLVFLFGKILPTPSLTNDKSCEMHLRVDLSTIALQIFGASTSNCKIPDLRYQMNQFNYLLLELSK